MKIRYLTGRVKPIEKRHSIRITITLISWKHHSNNQTLSKKTVQPLQPANPSTKILPWPYQKPNSDAAPVP